MSAKTGDKIKQIREENNISLSELSANSSIHQTQLELIEKGELIPSVATLVKISRALGTRLGTFLDGEETNQPDLHHANVSNPTISACNGNTEAREHLNFFALAQQKSDRHMEPFMINVEFCPKEPQRLSNHEGEEFLYVMEGCVELRYGNETYKIDKGDSIYFDSIVPHCMSTLKEGEKAKVLAVTYTPF